jgi:hypothetical protein
VLRSTLVSGPHTPKVERTSLSIEHPESRLLDTGIWVAGSPLRSELLVFRIRPTLWPGAGAAFRPAWRQTAPVDFRVDDPSGVQAPPEAITGNHWSKSLVGMVPNLVGDRPPPAMLIDFLGVQATAK